MNTDLLYSGETLDLFRRMLREPPVRVVTTEFMAYIFYPDGIWMADPTEWMVDTKDDHPAGACAMAFSRVDEPHFDLVDAPGLFSLDARPIDAIWVIRMGLTFSEWEMWAPDATDAEDIRRKVESVTSVEEMRTLSSGGRDERPCHPDDPALAAAAPHLAFLVDTGIVIQAGPDTLKVFSDGNGYTSLTIAPITDPELMATYRRDYQWVPVER